MRNRNFYLDIHILQTVPPSCINRDDTGSPKTAIYGGVTRARVSSQAWKRAMRLMFASLLAPDQIGQRTKYIVNKVAEKIEEIDPSVDSEASAIDALTKAGLTIKSTKKGTDALFFISEAQATALAKLITSQESDTAAYKTALKDNPSVDMCLFGRMVASDPSLNYDACAQIAHSISTHAVNTEFDYFTAVDDCAPNDSLGAGHLGTVEFNSSTLYRYATLNIAELTKHLGTTSVSAVRAFIEAFVCSMPTGRQNPFAHRTLPDIVYITIRKDQPVNLVGAFERPVLADHAGYVASSAASLYQYADKIYKTYNCPPFKSFISSVVDNNHAIVDSMPFNNVLDEVGNAIADFIDCGVK